MKRKYLQVMVVLAAFSLFALLTIQLYWFNLAFNEQERQFNEKVNIALRAVAHGLLLASNDSITAIGPITQRATNDFYVPSNSPASYHLVDSLVRAQLAIYQLKTDYQLTFYQAKNNLVLLGNYWANTTPKRGAVEKNIACIGRDQAKTPINFSVSFPSKEAYLAGGMGIWLFTLFTFLLVLTVFAYMAIRMLKEKKLSEMKTDFMNSMTHELKTPLTNLSIASEVLHKKHDQLDEQKRIRYASIVFEETQRLQVQVEHVLQIAALERGQVSLKMQQVNINELISSIAQTAQVKIGQRNGSINLQLKAENAIIKADTHHISNVLYNLLDNADKYSPLPPEITLSTYNTTNGLVIAVADKGMGMNKATQKMIFEKFFRASTGDVQQGGGFGLGLSYVEAIVKAHQGWIDVKSKPNEGSKFEVFFQCA
ncbi:HAMP domain-containing sensor histidine kinase [Rhodocytophaga aerolata]|uniref:histidine kinase n=1 Tax=Rhodocytophaga aerolata TaxID=455078 RepID=A0ABT8RE92_9BACT|nr:HAMP domain-containing sensor histidine kinase [Rhodocytophaga aerolata]MDO1450289.1 HAMP domain-containing sensor histidine kinase [Rhodocytophaga aerolata]